MKKVLIISYYFAQKDFIGSLRLKGLAKFLISYDWEPTILTIKTKIVPDPKFRVIETQYKDLIYLWKKNLCLLTNKTFKDQFGFETHKSKKSTIDHILDIWAEIFAYPDLYKGWYKFAINDGNRLLEKEKFDVIISSSSPITSHLIAKSLGKKFGIPWIADLRDLWTQNHYYSYSPLRKFIDKRLEVKTLSSADALITVSQPLAEKLKDLHRGKNIYVITNGFDPDEKNIRISLSNKFNITYTGYLYRGKQDPEPFFQALQSLILNNYVEVNDIDIDFYGSTEGWLEKDIRKYGLQDIIKVQGLIPREEALKKQREAQILLLFTWNDPNELGIYTGKIFEYLVAQRPILSIGTTGGVVEELLKVTKAGTHISNVNDIIKELTNAYRQFKSTGNVYYYGIDSEIDKYNQKEMARKFANILDIFGRKL